MLKFQVYTDPHYIVTANYDLKHVGEKEFIDYMTNMGDKMIQYNTGKVLADLSLLTNYGLSLRSAVINNLNKALISKQQYFVLAMVRSKSKFDNVATEIALKSALQLSSKFKAGKMFDTLREAEEWIINIDDTIWKNN
jgi:hypothetical protein